MKKIGIMGGTFNPIHNGHLLIAEAAMKDFELDKVLFMPSGVSYQKNTEKIIDSSHRVQMTALAVEGKPDFIVSTMEVERQGNTYTYETIEELKGKNAGCDYYFIIGADTLFSLETWKSPERLLSQCVILAAARGNQDESKLESKIEELNQKFHADIRIIHIQPTSVSSTLIRDKVKRSESIQSLVPKKVQSYIKEQGLYLE